MLLCVVSCRCWPDIYFGMVSGELTKSLYHGSFVLLPSLILYFSCSVLFNCFRFNPQMYFTELYENTRNALSDTATQVVLVLDVWFARILKEYALWSGHDVNRVPIAARLHKSWTANIWTASRYWSHSRKEVKEKERILFMPSRNAAQPARR